MHNFSVLIFVCFFTHLSFYTYCLPEHWRTDHRGLQVPHRYHGSHPATIFALFMALLLNLHAVVILGQLFPKSGCHKHREPFAEMGLCNTSQQGFAAYHNGALQHTRGFATHCNTKHTQGDDMTLLNQKGSYAQCKSGQDRSIATEDQTPTEEQAQHRTNTHTHTPTPSNNHYLQGRITKERIRTHTHTHWETRIAQNTQTLTLRNKHSTEHTHWWTGTTQKIHLCRDAELKKYHGPHRQAWTKNEHTICTQQFFTQLLSH